jgi:hypothetical protein
MAWFVDNLVGLALFSRYINFFWQFIFAGFYTRALAGSDYAHRRCGLFGRMGVPVHRRLAQLKDAVRGA